MLHVAESEEILRPAQTAKMLDVTADTLAVWRCTKRYNLAYIKIGKNVRYLKRDVLAFLESRRVQPGEVK